MTGAMTGQKAAALTATLGLAAACWVLSVERMNGMNMGVAVYALYRPHGTVAAGVVVIAAGLYELTPLKRHFRRRCREAARSGLEFGVECVGSSVGLMVMLVVLGVMSVGWMSLITVVVVAQKLLPAKAAVDVPVAVAIVGLGILILAAPSAVPGLMPTM